MGKITNYLTNRIGGSQTKQLLAIVGGFFIFAIGNFPIADFINSLTIAGYWCTYLIILWAGLVIAITAAIVLFFGKPPEYFNIKNEKQQPAIDQTLLSAMIKMMQQNQNDIAKENIEEISKTTKEEPTEIDEDVSETDEKTTEDYVIEKIDVTDKALVDSDFSYDSIKK